MRSIDRKLLASFIEYAANGVVTPNEWHRFIVNHYQDAKMEHARHECARIFHAYQEPGKLPASEKHYLYQLAQELRDAR